VTLRQENSPHFSFLTL